MKQYTKEEKKEILKNIRRHVDYAGIYYKRPLETLEPCMYPPIIRKNSLGFMQWTKSGSSASKINLAELDFLSTEIFDDCDELIPVEYDTDRRNYVAAKI